MSSHFEHPDQENNVQARENREERDSLYDQCREYLQQPVRIETKDGGHYEGIIEYVDNEYVYLLSYADQGPTEVRSEENRQVYGYGFPYYGPGYGSYYGLGYGYYGGYPFYGPYGYGYYGFPRRISRLVLPLAALAAISLLPYY